MQIKRVVTAVQADGKSIFQEDAVVPPATAAMFPGTEIWVLWGTEGPPSVRDGQPARSRAGTFFPGPGGTRFGIFTFPPEMRDAPPPEMPDPETLGDLAAEVEQKLPGLLGVFEPDAPGMHTTATVDYCVVLQGTLTLQLDDGAEAELPPGSCIVQNGTRHAWHNYGEETVGLAFVIIDSQRR
jgi:mannose-6-phosphate isomerase-like protein (cupin superfamily)